jgi:hypothetical protein
METLIYETPAYRIGNTEWMLIVFEKDDALTHPSPDVWEIGAARFTRYLWRRDTAEWRKETEHPKYNTHDGTWAGLPHGLRKIYEKHEEEIKQALSLEPMEPKQKPTQANMFQSGEDLPLFSNSPVKVATESYKPRPIQKQIKLLLMEKKA